MVASVGRTGRAIVVHEAVGFAGFGAEVAARVSERCFYQLESPVLRVTGLDIPYPPPKLEHWYLPNADRVLDAVERRWPRASATRRNHRTRPSPGAGFSRAAAAAHAPGRPPASG